MRRIVAGMLGVILLTTVVGWSSVHPSHQREWLAEQRLLPRIELTDRYATIHNVRNFRWGPGTDFREDWDTRSYELDQIETVWYVLTPFSRDRRGPAHAFLSFGFADGRFVSVSVEARRERGEEYSVVKGLLKQYELMYVIGDERDLVQLRTGRGDDVYVYPIRASKEQVRSLFTGILRRAHQLHERPEFYGTLRNNCTTNLLEHVNSIAVRPIGYGRRILLPGYSDEIAHERGLIDTDLDLDGARERFLVNDRADLSNGRADFSLAIRSSGN